MNIQDFNFLSEGNTERVIFVAEGQVNDNNSFTIPAQELMLIETSVSVDGKNWYTKEHPRYTTGTNPNLLVDSNSQPDQVSVSPNNLTGIWPVYYRVVGVEI